MCAFFNARFRNDGIWGSYREGGRNVKKRINEDLYKDFSRHPVKPIECSW